MHVFEKNSNIFNLLSEGISEGIIVVNEEQQIVATNFSAKEMFGYVEDELLGKPLDILIPTKYHHAHIDHVKDFIKKSGKRQMGRGRDLYGVRKGGEEFPVEAGLNPFELYGHTYVMALVINITERKKAEQELIHWARIFDESLNEIYIFDAQSLLFVDVNNGAISNMGYTLAEFRKLTAVNYYTQIYGNQISKTDTTLIRQKKGEARFRGSP